MGKILLFYKYVPIENPHELKKWQRELCESLELRGRIIIAPEGINGTVGGAEEQTQSYINALHAHPLFSDMSFKQSEGGAENFPTLRIKVSDEIVRLGIPADKLKPQDGGKHLTPEQAHELMKQKPEDLVILDTRNTFEASVGTFKDAIVTQTDKFRQFPEYIDKNLDTFKGKKVLMACTGGVRCERASAYLKQKGVDEVYQIEGGIHCYTEKYPDGFFRGKNYVFDSRVTVTINDDIIGSCGLCKVPCDSFINCLNAKCNKHFVCCSTCKQAFSGTCSADCKKLLNTGAAAKRPNFVEKHA